MARQFAQLRPRFWTGQTGRHIKARGSDCVVVALYLISAPTSNMIGLYYLPITTIAHETGIPFEGASKALASLSEAGFAYYDHQCEEVWVPEMAAHQIADTLKAGDNRIAGIVKELQEYRKSKFFMDFMARYKSDFCLPDIEPLRSPLQAPPKPLRSQEQEQEKDQEQEQEKKSTPQPPQAGAPASGFALEGDKPKTQRKPRTAKVEGPTLRDLAGYDLADALGALAAGGGVITEPVGEMAPRVVSALKASTPAPTLDELAAISRYIAAGNDWRFRETRATLADLCKRGMLTGWRQAIKGSGAQRPTPTPANGHIHDPRRGVGRVGNFDGMQSGEVKL